MVGGGLCLNGKGGQIHSSGKSFYKVSTRRSEHWKRSSEKEVVHIEIGSNNCPQMMV